MKYYHIGLQKPGKNPTGGVATFAAYLKRAIPELECLGLSDYPEHEAVVETFDTEYDWAYNMNTWALEMGILDEDSVVVCDGYWGYGLPGEVGRLISVVHGSYYGRFRRSLIAQWGEIVGMDHIEAQFEVWRNENTEIVCVAEESASELYDAGVGAGRIGIIHHGVDLKMLRPIPEIEPVCWMHGATSNRKGLDILNTIPFLDSSIRVEFMDEPSGVLDAKARRLNEAMALVAPTRHEGNSYLLLEAMACGVPLITYPTGLAAWEMDDRCGVITDDISPQSLIREMFSFDRGYYDPRGWIEENAGFDRFAKEWREYLGV